MNWQNPFLLRFQPLRLFKCAALGTMPILAGFIVKLQSLANETHLHHTAHRRRAAIDNRAHGFRLLIRKPMGLFIFTNMFAKDVSHTVMWMLGFFWRCLEMMCHSPDFTIYEGANHCTRKRCKAGWGKSGGGATLKSGGGRIKPTRKARGWNRRNASSSKA